MQPWFSGHVVVNVGLRSYVSFIRDEVHSMLLLLLLLLFNRGNGAFHNQKAPICIFRVFFKFHFFGTEMQQIV